jgi:branched-chain amino acid transport system permease protein
VKIPAVSAFNSEGMMELFLCYLTNGIVNGLIYAVVALGFTLILGVMEVINFSHGILFAFGAYFFFSLMKYVGFWVALILSALFVGVMGILIERLAVRRVYGKNPLFGLLLTFGLAMALEEVIRMVWGKPGHSVSAPDFVAGVVNLGIMYYSKYRLFLGGLSALVIFLVWLFLERTPYGAVIKAGTHDSEMVMALGKNLPLMRTLVFGLGAALAGVAGVIAAPIHSIRPVMGTYVLMPAFVIVVLGGIGSFWGSIIGGLIFGISTSLYPGRFTDIIPYLLMTLILLWRPRGLMGEKSILEV